MSEQTTEQPIAPADAGGKPDSPQEGVHPGVANPDQPVFPAPIGVDPADLKEMGVDHLHFGLPEGGEDDGEGVTAEEEGARPATEPEGKPADPKADEKNQAANKVAEANKATATTTQQGQQQSS